MEPLALLIQISFFALFAATLWRYMRHPSPIGLSVVAVFGTTAALFAISTINAIAPAEVIAILRPIALVALLSQPWLIVHLVDQISPLPTLSRAAVLVSFVTVTAALLILGSRNVPAILLTVAYFGAAEALAAVQFFRLGRRRVGLPRIRLFLAGTATILFGLTIVVAGLASAANAGNGGGAVTQLSRGFALVAAIGYLAAFVPPRWLTGLMHRAVAFDLTRSVVATGPEVETSVLWRQLGEAAQTILGTRTVSIEASDGRIVLDETDDEPVKSPHTVVTIPLTADGETATLTARLEGRPLFVEDDLAVLTLLGSLVARAVAHERRVRQLRDTLDDLRRSAAVRASEARFRALLDAHPNAVLATDEDGRVTWSTRSAVELFGATDGTLDGRQLGDLVDLRMAELLPAVTDADVRRIETVGRTVDGREFPAEVASKGFELDGRPGEVAVVTDVSWRHEANEIRDRFIGVLSHELRTPITSIYGGAQVLARRAMDLDEATRGELLTGLADESERLQRMIENLLVLARVEKGADFFGPGPVLIDRVIAEVVDRERALWPSASITLSTYGPLPVVSGDADHVAQILRNLLSNAVKYAGERAQVDLEVRAWDGGVRVLVRDDGPGIAEGDDDSVFQLFYRSERNASAPGAGIGLFVCRQLVQSMGGTIWARSGPDGGAEFGFTLVPYPDDEAGEIDEVGGAAERTVRLSEREASVA